MKLGIRTVIGGLLLLSWAASGFPPANASENESPYTVDEFVVAADKGSQQSAPALSGDIVVWTDRPGGYGTLESDVRGLDLVTHRKLTICQTAGEQLSPAISGNIVAWEDRRDDWSGDIYAYDLNTGREYAVATGPSTQSSPAISGNTIVWVDDRTGTPGIYARNLATGTEWLVAAGLNYQSRPRIAGDLVVWTVELKGRDGRLDLDVHGYDLATKRHFIVATGPALQSAPDVSNRRIVWTEYTYDSHESVINAYDVGSATRSTICRGNWEVGAPAISGDLVVWPDAREGRGYDIYGYDIRRNVSFAVCRAIGDQTSPSVDGNRVVWNDQRSQGVGKYDVDYDVYGATLRDGPGPTAPVTGAPSEVDAKVEVVWPLDGAPVAQANRANVGVYLFKPGSFELSPCQWQPTVRLWAALNNEMPQQVGRGTPGIRYTPSGATRMWEFYGVDVSAARDPLNRISFFVTVDGVETHTNIWSHSVDARTYYPLQALPDGIGGAEGGLDARIQVVWPHDRSGSARPVSEATLVNIGVDVFSRGTNLSVPPDWSGTVRLYRSLNNGVEEPVGVGQKTLLVRGGIVYPRWEFNDIAVSAATDPANRYHFRVGIDGVDTRSNIWTHGADARTYFPIPDAPVGGCS